MDEPNQQSVLFFWGGGGADGILHSYSSTIDRKPTDRSSDAYNVPPPPPLHVMTTTRLDETPMGLVNPFGGDLRGNIFVFTH